MSHINIFTHQNSQKTDHSIRNPKIPLQLIDHSTITSKIELDIMPSYPMLNGISQMIGPLMLLEKNLTLGFLHNIFHLVLKLAYLISNNIVFKNINCLVFIHKTFLCLGCVSVMAHLLCLLKTLFHQIYNNPTRLFYQVI